MTLALSDKLPRCIIALLLGVTSLAAIVLRADHKARETR